jgi:NitT/TauT family transport system substrate-binding protein
MKRKSTLAGGLLGAALVALAGTLAMTMPVARVAAAEDVVTIRLSVDEDPIVPRLAESLGYLKQAGVRIVRAKVEDFSKEDYLLQAPLIAGQIDASYHWFNHAVFGARHNLPVEGVMVFNDAPGMTVMVAAREKDAIKSAADFRGKHVAEGALYGTKGLLTSYLARKAGLPPHSYTPVMLQHDGRQEAVIKGLAAGGVDVMTFQEPITSALRDTGMVKTLYDLNSGASTRKVLGAAWPSQSLLVAPAFARAHPQAVQRLVTAFVKTMRYINRHSLDQIVAALPPSYFEGKDRKAEIRYLRETLPTFAKGDYSFSPAAVRLVVDTVRSYDFDDSAEGRWRGTAVNPNVDPSKLYTNRFVDAAMRETP